MILFTIQILQQSHQQLEFYGLLKSSIYKMLLGFKPSCNYKFIVTYVSFKVIIIVTCYDIPLKCDCIEGSNVNGIR